MNKEQGVIYIATGEKFAAMAVQSAKSLKLHCPDLPVHIFTDCDAASHNCFDSSTIIPDPHRRSKLDYIFETPYQKTLYLDADTRICEDITHMFDLLDRYDIALAYVNSRTKTLKRYLRWSGQAPKIFLPLNGGVILFNKTDPVMEFFQSWRKAYHKEGHKADQFTLREQLWLSDLRLLILPPEYNCRPMSAVKYLKRCGIPPKILHLRNFNVEVGVKPKNYPLTLGQRIKDIINKIIKDPAKRIYKVN